MVTFAFGGVLLAVLLHHWVIGGFGGIGADLGGVVLMRCLVGFGCDY